MTVYAIGDVQGCYTSLCRLLDKLRFDDVDDELWFCGDLVNRGPESANVIRLVKAIKQKRVVLGNHDLHLLAVALGFRRRKQTDSFSDVLKAPDRVELLSWIRGLPLAYFDNSRDLLLTHAGLHPHWSLAEALDNAREVQGLMRADDTLAALLSRMYGSGPSDRSDDTDRFDRSRWIINAFTRMRFCDPSGQMDFKYVGAPGTQPEPLSPWFQLCSGRGFQVIFGHWSALGACVVEDAVCLDSGCVYGGRLTTIDVDDQSRRFIQVPCSE